MLELGGVAGVDGDSAAIDMEFTDDRGADFEFLTKGRRRALAETKKADEDILLGVFIRQKGLPAAIGPIVPPHQFDLVGPHLEVDVLHADLSGPDVSALGPEVAHSGHAPLAQIAVLHAAGDQGHRDVSLDPVDPRPWRYLRQYSRYQVHQLVWVVVLVLLALLFVCLFFVVDHPSSLVPLDYLSFDDDLLDLL